MDLRELEIIKSALEVDIMTQREYTSTCDEIVKKEFQSWLDDSEKLLMKVRAMINSKKAMR